MRPHGEVVDEALLRVRTAIRHLDTGGSRFERVLRSTIDQLLDGQHTGRFRWEMLHKTEKTHAGTLVEINLAREFGFADGLAMDYTIDGVDVDCKFSQSVGVAGSFHRRHGGTPTSV